MEEMLKSEINSDAIRRRIVAAFRSFARFENRNARGSKGVFEHGQWWIITSDGAQYSVADGIGPGIVDGFDFECVTRADEAD